MGKEKSPYRGSLKHKSRPATGRKGSLCPEWTHNTEEAALGNDVFKHTWCKTVAHQLFKASEDDPEGSGRKFATENGIAFVAVQTNDGSWHGYPEPWNKVPAALVEKWRDERKVTRRHLKQYSDIDLANIRWALDDEKG